MKKLTFEDMTLILPDKNRLAAWKRLQKYMEVYFSETGAVEAEVEPENEKQ